MANKVNNTYEIKDNYAILKIEGSVHGDFEILIDIEDIDRCKEHKWSINELGWYKKKYFYIVNRKAGLLHRFIMNCPNDKVVDHINGDTLDNRKENLNNCSGTENRRKATLTSNNKSGHTGVIWYPYNNYNKWKATIKVKYKTINLGYFDKLEDAVKARTEAEEKYFGEFAPHKHINT